MTPAGIRVLTVLLGAASGCHLDVEGRQADTRFARPEAGTPTDASGNDDTPGAGDDGGATQRDAGPDRECDGDPSTSTCGYRFRRKLSFDATLLTEKLEKFPVLVTLNTERINYAETLPGGRDVRFLDADGRHLLTHEVELWNPGGTSYVWVQVPRLDPLSRHDIFMVYGSPTAPPPTHTKEVFSKSYESVYHLADNLSSTLIHDSCERHDGVAASSMNASGSVPGIVGGAIEFDGVDDLISLGSLSTSEWKGITIEAWVKHPVNIDGRVMCQASGIGYDDHVVCLGLVAGGVRAGLSTSGDDGVTSSRDVGGITSPDFTHLALVWHEASGELRVFQNGVRAGTFPLGGNVVTKSELPMVLGNVNLQDMGYLKGVIDEVRISQVARSDAWVLTTVVSSGAGAFTYGPEEAL